MTPPVPDTADKATRLNVLALPSYTAIIFALIALVVLSAACASLLPGSQLWWPPLVFGLTLLPLRDFLHWPDLWRRRHGLAKSGDQATDEANAKITATLETELAALLPARQAGATVAPPPVVILAREQTDTRVFGTFRRRYIGLETGTARKIVKGLQAEARRNRFRAILAHELAHFLNQDVWRLGLAGSLLKMMVLVALVSVWIGFALVLFIIEFGPEVLQPAFWDALAAHLAAAAPGLPAPNLGWILESMQRQNPTLIARLADPTQSAANWVPFFYYLTASYLPFFLSGLVLFVFYWRWLHRVRELYADARAAALTGQPEALREALAVYTTMTGLTPDAPSRLQRFLGTLAGLPKRVPILGPLLAWHPSDKKRQACLHAPEQVFGSWQAIAVSVGLAVVLLDLMLRGTLTAAHIYEPAAHLPFLIAFLVLAFWLLPKVCRGDLIHLTPRPPFGKLRGSSSLEGNGEPSPRRAGEGSGERSALLFTVLLFTAIKLLPHLLDGAIAAWTMLTDPAGGGQIIDLWAYSMTGGWTAGLPRLMGVEVSWPYFFNIHIVRPILYFALLMPPTLAFFLWTDAALKRRALTWYKLQEGVRRVFWAITGGLALLLALVVIPLFNHLVFPDIYTGWSAAALGGAALALLAALAGGLLFRRSDRRLAGRCPCGALTSGKFYLGKQCDHCGHVLHPWLTANY